MHKLGDGVAQLRLFAIVAVTTLAIGVLALRQGGGSFGSRLWAAVSAAFLPIAFVWPRRVRRPQPAPASQPGQQSY